LVDEDPPSQDINSADINVPSTNCRSDRGKKKTQRPTKDRKKHTCAPLSQPIARSISQPIATAVVSTPNQIAAARRQRQAAESSLQKRFIGRAPRVRQKQPSSSSSLYKMAAPGQPSPYAMIPPPAKTPFGFDPKADLRNDRSRSNVCGPAWGYDSKKYNGGSSALVGGFLGVSSQPEA
jgi:hypothetical protein